VVACREDGGLSQVLKSVGKAKILGAKVYFLRSDHEKDSPGSFAYSYRRGEHAPANLANCN
jgi:hypothetical protein